MKSSAAILCLGLVSVSGASLLACNTGKSGPEEADAVGDAAADVTETKDDDRVDSCGSDLDGAGGDESRTELSDSTDGQFDGRMGDVGWSPRMLEWQAFGETHVMLSIDNSVLQCDDGDFCWDEWVSRYEVTLTRTDGLPEIILSGKVASSSWTVWPERLTEVAAIAASPGESVGLCLLLYGSDDTLFASGCQDRTLLPGTFGQVLWQLSTSPCQTQPYLGCQQPLEAELAPDRTPTAETPTLFYSFTLGEQPGVAPPSKTVSLAFAPPPTCDVASEWFRTTVIDDPTVAFDSCLEPPEGSYPWTYARLEMPSVHAAMGLFHEIVSLPEAVPAAVLWEAVWADKVPDDGLLVGASLGQLGTAQAQYECEVWACQ